jgi:hypothetical protein
MHHNTDLTFEDDRPRNNRSGPYDRQRPRDRPPVDEPEDIEMRLKSLIIKIGDKVCYYIRRLQHTRMTPNLSYSRSGFFRSQSQFDQNGRNS